MLVQKLCLPLNRDNQVATDGERFSNAYSFSHIEKWIVTRYPTSYKTRYIIFCHLQFGPQSLCLKNINKHANLQSKFSRMTLGISLKNRLSVLKIRVQLILYFCLALCPPPPFPQPSHTNISLQGAHWDTSQFSSL
jgi:hypothetical protein